MRVKIDKDNIIEVDLKIVNKICRNCQFEAKDYCFSSKPLIACQELKQHLKEIELCVS